MPILDLPKHVEACRKPDEIIFEFDLDYCKTVANLMGFEVVVEGVEELYILTTAVDGTEYPEQVSDSSHSGDSIINGLFLI